MPMVTLVAHVLTEREEEWRRFVQEVVEEHLLKYEELRRRLGIQNESVWLAHTKGGQTATVVVHLEIEDPERMVSALATSEEPFDLWCKEQLLEYHCHDLASRRVVAELIFANQDVADDSHRPEDAGQLMRGSTDSEFMGRNVASGHETDAEHR